MKTPRVSDVIGIINKIAPVRFAEGWDNPGLQVGDSTASAKRIMVALDASQGAVDAAIAQGCTLLLTHHPLIFKPLKRLSRQDPDGALVCRAIEGGLTIVALHTNYDVAAGGVNDLLAERLGITVTAPLQVTAVDELAKLVVFVPDGHEDTVLKTLSRFIWNIGNYSECSFRVAGTGVFRPLEGASPFIGTQGERASVQEFRIEIILRRSDSDAAVAAMKRVHPYEEPAYDLYPLANRGDVHGLGRIGDLPVPVPLLKFAQMVKDRLDIPALRYVGDPDRTVKRIALCGGSGISLLREARFRGADLLLTGDIKYHDAREAESFGIALVDAGHFATERSMVPGLAATLGLELALIGFAADLVRFDGEKEPFYFV